MAVNWDRVGHANAVVAMAAINGKLFAVTKDNKLWWRDPVGVDVNWDHIGHANNVVAMAALNGKLFAVTSDSRLWSREPMGADVRWDEIGNASGVVAMSAIDGRLLAATSQNRLWRRYPVQGIVWDDIGSAFDIVAMAAMDGKVFAATSDNQLLWTAGNPDLIDVASAEARSEATVVRLSFTNAGQPLQLIVGSPTSTIPQPVRVTLTSTAGRVVIGATQATPSDQTEHSIFVSPPVSEQVWLRPISVGEPGVPGDVVKVSSIHGELELEVWIEPTRGDWRPRSDQPTLDAGLVPFHAALMPKRLQSEMILFSPARELDGNGQPVLDAQGHEVWDLQNLHNVEIRALNPMTMTSEPRPQELDPVINLFCVGQAHQSDGRLLTAGGHVSLESITHPAADRIHVYDPDAGSWYRSPARLRHHRWYPTVTELPDGRMLITSGSSQALTGTFLVSLPFVGFYAHLENIYEFYDPMTDSMIDLGPNKDPKLVDLPEPIAISDRPLATYPAVFVLPGTPNASSGVLFLQEANRGWMFEYHPDSQPPLTRAAKYAMPATGSRSYPHYGSAVLLPFIDGAKKFKILIVGGQDESITDHRVYDDIQPATATAVIFDYDSTVPLNAQPGWRRTGAMSNGRVLCDATILPTGEILVTGGVSRGWSNHSYVQWSVRSAEIYDPGSETFRLAAGERFDRRYHSTALIRPDGAVLKMGSSGGFENGVGDDGKPWISSHTEIEIYYPPYAWRSPRPTVRFRGAGLPYQMPETAEITGYGIESATVVLMRAGAVTHGLDMDQRHIQLPVTSRSKSSPAGSGKSRATLGFRAPTDATYAPPGAYLFFVVDAFGVPSEGQWVMIGSPAHAHDAMFISQNAPQTMILGDERDVTVTMRNTGTDTWTPGAQFRLGSDSPPDNRRWGLSRVDLPEPIAPGENATFIFRVKATVAGRVRFQWRMLQEGIEWFGERTPAVTVTVTQAQGPTIVPDVVGWTRPNARAEVIASDLVPRFRNLRPISRPALATVAVQNPAAGTSVARQSEVELYMESG